VTEAYNAEFYKPTDPKIKQGDTIRVEVDGKVWLMTVEEPVVPEVEWNVNDGIPIFRGYKIKGSAILEKEL
jgi:hypothetical protein